MNAPATAQAVTFHIALLAECAPSHTRTQDRRRARFTKEEIAELAGSIKEIGVLEPIIVRPHPKAAAPLKYEIVAGERRWLAAAKADLADIPVIVREVADADLVQLQLIENLQRKTLDQLDEAEGYDELRKLKKFSPEQVADLLGISRSTVFNRLKLLDLCPEARKALEEGKLPASNAILIARLGHHDTQRAVLKEALAGGYEELVDEKGHAKDVAIPLSYRALAAMIQSDYMVDLKAAPFKLDDETLLPKAGSCVKCPKRAGNRQDLFSDIKNPNVCTDPKCYDDKRQAVFKIKAEELRAKGRKVIAGADAKKVFPRWNDECNDGRVAGGFHAMSEKLYSSNAVYGKTPKQLLGKDYTPIIAQHPGTGQLVELASAQAIASAANGKKPGRDDDDDVPGIRKAKKAKTPKLDLPDLDDQVEERIVQLLAEKAPKVFSRGYLLKIAKLAVERIRAHDDKLAMIAKHYDWPKNSFGSGDPLPKQAQGFDEPKLLLLLALVMFAESWGPSGREDILEAFGLQDENKIREQIIAERKQAQANARMKAKLAKASPLVKSKKAAKGKKK